MSFSSKVTNFAFGLPILGNLLTMQKNLADDIQANRAAYSQMSQYDKDRYDANPYWRGEEASQYATDAWNGLMGTGQAVGNAMVANQMMNGQRFTHGAGALQAATLSGRSGGLLPSMANKAEAGLFGKGALGLGLSEAELGELLPMLLF
jgi:pectin methylesterase-like acyl-CoA thioesterase